MAFVTAAGITAPKTSSLTVIGDTAPRLQSGPAIRGSRISQDGLLNRMSGSLCESAITRHTIDFERVDRHTETLVLLKDSLADLKARMHRKVCGRTRITPEIAALALSYKAS